MSALGRYWFIITAIFLALLLAFLMTGFVHVRDGEVAFLSKKRKLVRTLRPGWHYAFPLTYAISRRYRKGETKKIKAKGYAAIGRIEDPKAYEFADPSPKKALKSLLKGGEPDIDAIKEALAKDGFALERIESLHDKEKTPR
jgi:regulator of protease activity HflC (stomatin/prohibitin superfamily)